MDKLETCYFNWFVGVGLISLIIRIVLAVYVPLTGDEACFAVWGKFLAWGYYDHTPLIGWILHPLLLIGRSSLILRLPTLIAVTLIGVILYRVIKPYSVEKASLIGILYFISPINLCGILISTDVPLIFFSFLSGVFLFLAIKRRDNLWYYTLSGLCLGLAFFSKYFAILLAFSYLVYFVITPKTYKRTLGFVLLFLGVLPFGLINLYWNYTHAWANILFNLYTRNAGASFGLKTLFSYLLIVVYIVTPPIFYYLCKYGKKLFEFERKREFAVFVVAFLFPFTFFLLLSSIKSIGLHWPLSFIPFVYLTLSVLLSAKEMGRSLKFMVGFTGIHLLLLVFLLMMPVSFYQHLGFKGSQYANLVFIIKHPQIRSLLDRYDGRYVITSSSYAKTMLMFIDSGYYAPSFGVGSVHGRQDDLITDFKTLAHRDFLIFLIKPPKLERFTPYFKRVKVEELAFEGAKYYLVFGSDFQYMPYRDTVLREIYDRYWQVPDYLPYKTHFYCEKYFKEEGICREGNESKKRHSV